MTTPETPPDPHATPQQAAGPHAASQPAPFAERLTEAVRRRGTPACVGLDPRSDMLPPIFRAAAARTPAAMAEIYELFCREVIDAVAGSVPIVKPQLACFESLGPEGMLALAGVINHAHAKGLLVLADGKRGDIGSAAEAYAAGWLAGPWAADAVTVNPYLGLDSLEPFVAAAEARQAGIFVLVKTSNPGSRDFQDLEIDGRTVFEHVAAGVEALAARTAGDRQGLRYGAVGAVVGATWPKQLASLREAMPHAWILVPGFGRQGGRAADVLPAFDDDGLGAIVVSARDVIYAHARPEINGGLGEAQWQQAVERAAADMITRLADETPAGRLR